MNTHLVTLRQRVDAHFEAAVARTPEAFACRAGCDRCCQVRISVFAVEAEPIREALAELERRDPGLRAQVRAQGRDPDGRACALLVDGQCTVYAQRPLICRSHGLPIAVADPDDPDGPLTVDHCPLNFQPGPRREDDSQPREANQTTVPRASVLVLDAVNRPLAVLAELTAPGAARVALADLAAAP